MKILFAKRCGRNIATSPKADVAISPGGSTCWELEFMGLPSILLVLAENQRLAAEKLDAIEVAANLGYHQDICHNTIEQKLSSFVFNRKHRLKMSQNCQCLVEGSGTMQISQLIKNFQ